MACALRGRTAPVRSCAPSLRRSPDRHGAYPRRRDPSWSVVECSLGSTPDKHEVAHGHSLAASGWTQFALSEICNGEKVNHCAWPRPSRSPTIHRITHRIGGYHESVGRSAFGRRVDSWLHETAASTLGLLLMAFTIASSQALVRHLDLSCGCFGGSEPISYWMVARDVVMLLACLALVRSATRGSRPWAWLGFTRVSRWEKAPLGSVPKSTP